MTSKRPPTDDKTAPVPEAKRPADDDMRTVMMPKDAKTAPSGKKEPSSDSRGTPRPRLPWPARDSHPARQRDDRDKTAGRPPVSRGHDDDDEKTRFFAAPRAADTAAAGAEEDASGGDDPVVGWLVIVEGPGRGRSCELGAGANSIGRDASQKICLDFGDQEIHREKHTVIVYDPRSRRFFLQPGEARNLTYLGDDVVLAPTPLKGGEIISIGRTQLRFVPLCGEDFSW
ncbi:MAG TPA: FHA domain-containing protein [Pseudolabrys sp.]|nr:FHA domain-containing protein [Pseudolabrys sp.]